MWHQALCRVYGVMRVTDYENQYLPRALVNALGFDYDNLQANLAQLRYLINSYAIRANRIAVPNDMAYMIRHAWLEAGVYTDSNAYKAQLYVFNMRAFYMYDEVTDGPNTATLISPWATGEVTEPTPGDNTFINKLLTLTDIQEFSDKLLNAVLQSESFGITTGDIMKAFGRSNLMALAEISEDYKVVPKYEEEVLMQIENLDRLDMGLEAAMLALPITQDTSISSDGYIITPSVLKLQQSLGSTLTYDPSPLTGAAKLTCDRLLNFHHNDVTPDDAIVASRITLGLNRQGSIMMYTQGTSPNTYVCADIPILSVGSEWCFGVFVTHVDDFDTGKPAVVRWRIPFAFDAADDIWVAMRNYGLISKFDWAPAITGFYAKTTNISSISSTKRQFTMSEVQNFNDSRDIDNFAILSADSIARMHEVALLSLFDSPKIQLMSIRGV